MLMNSDGEILIDSKEIKHNLEEFEKVKEKRGLENYCCNYISIIYNFYVGKK